MIRVSTLLTSTTLGVVLATALPASAQQIQGGEHGRGMQGMQGGSMQGMPQGQSMQGMQHMNMENMNPVQKEFHASMQKMNQEMMQGMMDSDPGKSWMKQMIAHHQGAVEMSEIVLKHTKDDDVRKEARKTKEQNEKDIKELQAELRKKER